MTINANTPLPEIVLGVPDYMSLREDNNFFIDKTAKLPSLVNMKRVFFARPRRFGKTLLISMLEELFKHGDTNFAGTAVYGKWPFTERYPVVKISFILQTAPDIVTAQAQICKIILRAFLDAGCILEPADINRRIIKLDDVFDVLRKYVSSHKFVILIDEWDYPLSTRLNNEHDFNAMRNILAEFYSWLRTISHSIKFMLVTGIGRYRESSLFTGQDLTDYSMDPLYADLLGYTQAEVEHYFAPYIARACTLLGCSRDELLSKLKAWYDGFCFDYDASARLYCPWSINKFFAPVSRNEYPRAPVFASYWMNSSNVSSALRALFASHRADLSMLHNLENGVAISMHELSDPAFFNEIKLLPLLVQAGYLSIKKIVNPQDATDEREFICGFPNCEIAKSYMKIFLAYAMHCEAGQFSAVIRSIKNAFAAGDFAAAWRSINELLRDVPYESWQQEGESMYRMLIANFLKQADFCVREEVHNNVGRSDIEVSDAGIAYIIELKLIADASSEQKIKALLSAAAAQIERKGYGINALNRTKTLIGLPVVISATDRQIVGWCSVKREGVSTAAVLQPRSVSNQPGA